MESVETEIKANELRIGNWLFDKNLKPVQVENAIFDCGINHTYGEPELMFYSDKLSAIPLTPEILGAFGAIKNSWGGFTLGPLELNDNLVPFIDTSREGQNEFQFEHVKNVHQLQNLYFALMGEELEITL